MMTVLTVRTVGKIENNGDREDGDYIDTKDPGHLGFCCVYQSPRKCLGG